MNNQKDNEGIRDNPEDHEQRQPHPPRVYVADLSAYNNGTLHGVWVDATQDPDSMWEQINSMLAQSPEASAEEIAIHDYENFGPLSLSEYESITTVSKIGQGFEHHGRAFLHWVAYVGTTDADYLDQFEDAFQGEWSSMEEYVGELADAYGIERTHDEHVPDFIRPYVRLDVEALARDLSFNYYVARDEQNGGVFVFES